jgi:hypothetical protein
MEKFKKQIAAPYNSEDPEHEQKLLLLWEITFPKEELLERKSTQWSKLGFQGKGKYAH